AVPARHLPVEVAALDRLHAERRRALVDARAPGVRRDGVGIRLVRGVGRGPVLGEEAPDLVPEPLVLGAVAQVQRESPLLAASATLSSFPSPNQTPRGPRPFVSFALTVSRRGVYGDAHAIVARARRAPRARPRRRGSRRGGVSLRGGRASRREAAARGAARERHPDRHDRRDDAGEPILRPLLRAAAPAGPARRRGRAAARDESRSARRPPPGAPVPPDPLLREGRPRPLLERHAR